MLLLCNYYVTYRCNAYCEFCHFADHSRYKASRDTELEDFRTNVRQISELGARFIDLTGGEPLLNRNLPEMALYARSLGMQTSITTNTLLYPKFADRLAGNINLLHFSLDSPDEEEHNRIRNINCYRSVMESIRIAKSLGEFPDILFTVTDETYKKLPGMYDIAVKEDLVLIINPVFSYFGNPGLSMEALEYIKEFISDKKNVYINEGFIRLRQDGGNNISSPSCRAVSRVIVISPDNSIILPCYHFAHKNITIDRPIAEIMKTAVYEEFRKMEGKFSFCQGCTVNCYFEPSFAFPINLYSFISLRSKVKYSFYKLVRQKIKKYL
ncbi:MAG: radical SAM/SPASM domain-containing protein [Syntrophothermus sp.]